VRRLSYSLIVVLSVVVFWGLVPVPTTRAGEGEVSLLTDEAIPRYLSRGQQLARNGEWAKMIDILQRVIEGDATIFPELNKQTLNSAVHTSDGILYYPARELCVQELSKLPPEALSIYRTTYDVPAEKLFKQAQATPDLDQRLEKLTEVFDTYLVSSFGDDALDESANLSLQLGRYFPAIANYRRLLEVYPRDSDRDLVMARTKAAYCAARIGDRATRDAMLEQLIGENPGRRVLVEGKRVAVEDLYDHPVMQVIGGVELGGSDDWTIAGGDPARHRAGEDIPVDLPSKPFWSFGLDKRDSRFWDIAGFWGPRSYDRTRAVAPAAPGDFMAISNYPTVRPVVHDGIVFYKDYTDLVPRRASSGSLVMHVNHKPPKQAGSTRDRIRIPVSHFRPGTGINDQPTDGSRYEMIYRWYDYGGTDVVATNDHVVITRTTYMPLQYVPGRAAGTAPPNAISVHRRDNGKLLWAYEQTGAIFAKSVRLDPEQLAAWKKDHSLHQFAHFRGPGVVSGGILYTVADEKDGPKDQGGGVSLWAMRIADGRVLFRTQLHHHDEIRTSLPGSASIAVAGTVAYITTNSGILAAVDALPPGRIRWIRRYKRGFAVAGRGSQKQIHIRFTHNEPIVAAGKVIIATPDAQFVEAIDAETGRLAWRLSTAELKDIHHIVGISGQKIVFAGSSITAVDLQTGKVAWSHEQLGTRAFWPYGRGFVGKKYAYVPATIHAKPAKGDTSVVHRFDLETGEPAGRLTFDVPRLGNILCVGGRLIAASEDRVVCFLSPEREEKRLDKRVEENPGRVDPLVERALFYLALTPPASASAAEDLHAASEAAGDDAEAKKEPTWRLLHLLIDEARAEKSTEHLADARLLAERMIRYQEPRKTKKRPYEAQIALLEAEILATTSRPDEAIDTLERFLDHYPNEEVVVGDRVVGVRRATRMLRDRLLKNPEFRVAFESSVRGRIAQALKAKDVDALAAIPEHYGNQAPSEESYFALARLYREQNKLSAAELALRSVLRDFPSHPRRAEAHIELAIVLGEQKLLFDARRERDQGLAILDEAGRKKYAEQIAELAKLLPDEARAAELPSLELPLRIQVLENPNREPIPVSGKRPAETPAFTLVTDGSAYLAIAPDGKTTLWKQPMPTHGAVSLGALDDPITSAVAAAISHARLARFDGEDLVIADVHGITRVHAKSGKAIWSWPHERKPAAEAATSAITRLRIILETLARDGHLNRRSPLPAHVVRDGTLIRIDPAAGVKAFTLGDGDILWEDDKAKGDLAGPPSLVGQLLAIGRSFPGRIEIFDVVAGSRIRTIPAPAGNKAVLLAAPKLDRLGRLYVIAGSDSKASSAAFHVLDTRNGKSLREPIPVHSRYAAILYADGELVLFHDGSSGGENLHFLELAANAHQRKEAEDIGRDIHILQDGTRLFVLSYKAGVADEGARLFRINLAGRATLAYQRIERALAYARPLLTERYVVVAGSDAREAHVRLFDREASKDFSPPAKVFPLLGGRKMTGIKIFEPEAASGIRFAIPPAVAADGKALMLSHPFGTFRLAAAAPR